MQLTCLGPLSLFLTKELLHLNLNETFLDAFQLQQLELFQNLNEMRISNCFLHLDFFFTYFQKIIQFLVYLSTSKKKP